MLKYFIGLIKNLGHMGVSLLAFIDDKSMIDKKAKVNRFVKVFKSRIDSYSYIGSKTELIGADIGKFCSVAHRCSIGLGTHTINHISTSPIFSSIKNGTGHSWVTRNIPITSKRVIIGNDVWIGIQVIVMAGVKIGNGAIIAAGSIVTKDVPDYAIVGGIPAKVIRYRFEKSIIDRLNEIQWWDWSENKLKKNLVIFQKNNISLEDLQNFN